MGKGIFYLMEGTIALLLMGMILIAASLHGTQKPGEKINELYITQRLHDLLKCRFIEKNFSLAEMESDFKKLFPGKSGFVELDGERIEIGLGKGKAIAVNAVYYSSDLKRSELRALVYTD